MSEPEFVRCPECGNEQGDMGNGVCCEECGYGPMPTKDHEPVKKNKKRRKPR